MPKRLYHKTMKEFFRYSEEGSWHVRPSHDPARREYNTRKTDIAEARIAWAEMQVRLGHLPKPAYRSTEPRTFREVAEKIYKRMSARSKATREQAKYILIDRLVEHFKDLPLVELKRDLFQDYIDSRYVEGFSVETDIKWLGTVERFARENGFIRGAPFKLFNPAPAKGRGKSFSRTELARIMWAARPNRDLMLQVKMGYSNGFRRGEILGFRADFVDWRTGQAYLPPVILKTKKTDNRAFELNRTVFRILKSRRARKTFTNYLFPMGEGHVLNNKTAWRQCLKRARVKGRFHDLRHTAITNMIASGISPADIQILLGVAPQVIRRYTHPTRTVARMAANVRPK